MGTVTSLAEARNHCLAGRQDLETAASTAEQDLVWREKGLSDHVEFLLLKGPGMTTC